VVEFSLDLTATTRHLVQVRLRLTPRQRHLALRLPAWTPGSYLIRDYVRNLEGLEITQSGVHLRPKRRQPADWLLELAALEPLEIRYGVLASELTVRTCHLDTDHGFLALAAVALQVEGERWSRHRLELVLPPGWTGFVPLPQEPGGAWIASSYDALIDSPVEAGPHRVHVFDVAGVPHRWVCWQDGGDGLGGGALLERHPDLLADLAAVCGACCRLMGEDVPPAPDYLFVLHLLEQGYGGLEHDRSTVLQYGRRGLEKPDGYRKLLQLAAHEYLHQWNVRRLRPVELTPIDYDRPVIVPTLWFAEGVTSYFDQFLPLAAGLGSEDELWEDLGSDLSRYLLTPGRLGGQSLRRSSQEAWVKLYRREADSDDSQVSYYLKGAVIALAIDLQLRRSNSSLSAVLRDLWRRFGRWGRGYSEADLLASLTAAAPELDHFLPEWLDGHRDPDLGGLLADVGLELTATVASEPFTGLRCAEEASGLIVTRVQRDGPAQRAGLVTGDELIALDRRRVRQPDDLAPLLRAGRSHQVLIQRRGSVRELVMVPDPPAVECWRLTPDPANSAQTLERRREWLTLI
jgi:predicted metalloprotease with PDZ domain